MSVVVVGREHSVADKERSSVAADRTELVDKARYLLRNTMCFLPSGNELRVGTELFRMDMELLSQSRA